MKTALIFLLLFVAGLASAAQPPQVQARLLDSNQYLCDNCFFGASTYYYCFEADHRILIGYSKIPTLNWADPASNDLAKLHKSWKPLKEEEAQTVPLRYDDSESGRLHPGDKLVLFTFGLRGYWPSWFWNTDGTSPSLVTGATGMIGQALVPWLARRNDVAAIFALTHASEYMGSSC